jgi:hypothetical protein
VAIGIHWYPRDWDLGTYRSWWLGIKVLQGITPTGSRKNVKKKRSSQHVWCSACWTCGPPEAWQMLNWGIYVPFCFSMKVNLHLYVHFLLYCTF